MSKAYLREFSEEEIEFARQAVRECADKLSKIGLVLEIDSEIGGYTEYRGPCTITSIFDIDDCFLTGALDKHDRIPI